MGRQGIKLTLQQIRENKEMRKFFIAVRDAKRLEEVQRRATE